MLKYYLILFMCFILFSCTKADLNKINKLLNNYEFDKVENLIIDGKVSDMDGSKELFFECLKNELILAAKRNDYEYIKNILDTKDFSQEQYDEICESIYNIYNSYKPILALIDTKLPPNTFCGRNTLLQCAVIEQDLNSIERLIQKGADCNLRDRQNGYNPLFLSVEYDGPSSFAIFNVLLRKTNISINDYFSGISNSKKMNVSGWYFEHILQFRQKDMLDKFLEEKNRKEMVINHDKTLEVLTWFSDYEDVVPNRFIENNFKIDVECDYFYIAILNLNYKIIPELISKNVSPLVNGEDFIHEYLHANHEKEIGMFVLDTESENYHKIISLTSVIDEYIETWKRK